jgi:hypothetical protein
VATPLTFEFHPTATDLISSTGMQGWVTVNDFMARDTYPGVVLEFFIHASLAVTVMRGTEDVSQDYAVYRFTRVWERPLGAPVTADQPPTEPTVAYTKMLRGSRMLIDSAQKPAGQWTDCPGRKTGIKRWTASTRTLAEFVLGAEDPAPTPRKMQDDAGGIYYAALFDISPKWFRVRLSDAITLTPTQWKGVRGLPPTASPIPANAPYRTEASAGLNWPVNSTWISWSAQNDELQP